MVEMLLANGSDENKDLGNGVGNAICVAATLATVDGYLKCQKESQAVKKLITTILEHNADFTQKVFLTSGQEKGKGPPQKRSLAQPIMGSPLVCY